MSAYLGFIDRLKTALPDQLGLIDKLAGKHEEDVFGLMRELNKRHLLPHNRICKLWGDSLGKAYVNPFEVQLPSGDGTQLPRKVAAMAQAIVVNTLDNAATIGMAEPQTNAWSRPFRKSSVERSAQYSPIPTKSRRSSIYISPTSKPSRPLWKKPAPTCLPSTAGARLRTNGTPPTCYRANRLTNCSIAFSSPLLVARHRTFTLKSMSPRDGCACASMVGSTTSLPSPAWCITRWSCG